MGPIEKGLVKCRKCGAFILSSDLVCHHCRAEQPTYRDLRMVTKGVRSFAYLAALILFGACLVYVLVFQDNLTGALRDHGRAVWRFLGQ